jgi:uncharacterized protein Veg
MHKEPGNRRMDLKRKGARDVCAATKKSKERKNNIKEVYCTSVIIQKSKIQNGALTHGTIAPTCIPYFQVCMHRAA